MIAHCYERNMSHNSIQPYYTIPHELSFRVLNENKNEPNFVATNDMIHDISYSNTFITYVYIVSYIFINKI